MNNVNMGGMNAMGGPVGGMPMMNSGAPGGIIRPPMPANDNQRQQLNTYIYEYFIRNGMFDCARSLLNSEQPIKIIKDSPGRRQDNNGNGVGNGTGEDGTDGDSKDDLDSKRPDDLPAPDVPRDCPESCFLYEWWCLFWDMFNAQRGKGDGRSVLQYVNHTQQQSRLRQEQQNQMMRQMMPAQYQQMMRMSQQNGMNMGQQDNLRQKAIHNTTRNQTPQQMQLIQQKNAMQRDPSGGDQQRPGSPGSAENAPSPSKRPRLDGGGNGFNPQQMPNGRGQPMPQQFQNMPGGANPQQARTLNQYQAGLAQQQANQMPGKGMPAAGGPANQGSPMMAQGQDTGAIAGYYNAGEMANGLRAAGQQGAQPGGNHALQDYQTQLMLLEQQNKKRLMMARQEQDTLTTVPGGREGAAPGAIGPNGQPFQGTSPQGTRSVNSPNPADQMKRTPHMNPAGMPSSPLPDGPSRSPGGMNFNMQGGQMDPNMAAPYFKMNGMDPNMVGGMQNNMRPPSSHPGFTNQLTPQQMAMARQQNTNANWQGGQNGQMIPGANPGAPQQSMAGPGTPQQRQMPPPAAPAAAAATNGRAPGSPQQGAAPPTPQQANKPNPKKKNETKDTKAKKGSAANLNSGATPSAESAQEPATPTPATPITPIHPSSFKNGQSGAVQPIANGQSAAQPMSAGINAPPQPDPVQAGFGMDNATAFDLQSFEFANPNNGSSDVLQDFDFDSFLHQDAEGVDAFNFDTSGFLEGEIGAD